jgi:hypothetical protein
MPNELAVRPESTGAPLSSTEDPVHDLHHGSHAGLLDYPSLAGERGSVDALVVPTIRPVARLEATQKTARELGCKVVVLCSGKADARATIAAADKQDVSLLAVELPVGWEPVRFQTTRLLAGTRFGVSDLAAKRNLGLIMARAAGWNRVVFLDDDISIPPDDVRRACRLLDDYDAVGFRVTGCLDNSVVCHVNRLTGGAQGTFVGAGALAVAASRTTAFFPQAYNEDWLFLLDAVQQRRVALIGEAVQDNYDPFASPRRARAEEFGDTLAEGLYWLLDTGASKSADLAFWSDFVGRRRRFIELLKSRVPATGFDEVFKQRMTASLDAAQESQRRTQPARYVQFLEAWREDREVWHAELTRLAALETIDKVFADLGLVEHHRSARFERECVSRDSAVVGPRTASRASRGSAPRSSPGKRKASEASRKPKKWRRIAAGLAVTVTVTAMIVVIELLRG